MGPDRTAAACGEAGRAAADYRSAGSDQHAVVPEPHRMSVRHAAPRPAPPRTQPIYEPFCRRHNSLINGKLQIPVYFGGTMNQPFAENYPSSDRQNASL